MDKRWHTFLHDIIRAAYSTDGQTLPAALEEKMIADLSIQLEDKINDLILSLLPDETDCVAYQNLVMQEASGQAIRSFLETRIPAIEHHMQRCLQEFRNDYLRLCQPVK